MSFSDRSASEFPCRAPTLRRVETIESGATVRHVDQLETAALEEVREILAGERSTVPQASALEEGEVIVFTDYYRVERS
ncbi:hypothetical protein [Natrialba sp. INN-245]|uniref:hypothetical protein n=1 Tax=Natrialba sp. INN-245 TaxID=2690967 RepID=UPI00135801A3|nr:hypothetical protein [Natrialba sp. INN-245]